MYFQKVRAMENEIIHLSSFQNVSFLLGAGIWSFASFDYQFWVASLIFSLGEGQVTEEGMTNRELKTVPGTCLVDNQNLPINNNGTMNMLVKLFSKAVHRQNKRFSWAKPQTVPEGQGKIQNAYLLVVPLWTIFPDNWKLPSFDAKKPELLIV